MTTATQYNAHYLSIGRMLVVFQSLEATLKDGLFLLMNNELGTPAGQLVHATVSELSFGTAARLASAVPAAFTPNKIGAKDDASLKQLQEALSEAEARLKNGIKLAIEAEQRRNQLVHSRWFISPNLIVSPGTMMRMKTRTKAGSMAIDIEAESIADVDANTEKAKQAQALIGGALQDYQVISKHPW